MSGRSCGPCTECCTAIGVTAIEKPAMTACHYLGMAPRISLEAGSVNQVLPGCRVYSERPQECQAFACGWLSGLMRAEDRPDALGVLFTASDTLLKRDLNMDTTLVLEVRDGALKEPRVVPALQRLARERVLVLVDRSGAQRIVGPRRELERVRRWNERMARTAR